MSASATAKRGSENAPGNLPQENDGAGVDVCWRAGDRWYMVTQRPPREVRREPMAVYYGAKGLRYQYAYDSRPRGIRTLPET
jgi:hypothetical protein